HLPRLTTGPSGSPRAPGSFTSTSPKGSPARSSIRRWPRPRSSRAAPPRATCARSPGYSRRWMRMPSVAVIRHVVFEDLGVWHPWFEGNGWTVEYVDAPIADLGAVDPLAADLLIVLGGPIGAYQQERYPFLVEELKLIERRLAAERPLLAVCLGAQLVATALGARVGRMERKEIGFAPITLTEEGRQSALVPLAEG